MTTATDTTTGTSTTGATVKDVRAAEVSRLEDAVAESGARLGQLAAERAKVEDDQKTATAALTVLQAAASTLQQQLCAAKTGPERHALELALDDNLISQGPATDQLLTAEEAVARAGLALKYETALAEKAKGDLARATAALVQSRQDAATATAWRTALDTTVPETKAAAAATAPREQAATARIQVLLGGPSMLDLVAARVTAARALVAQRWAAVVTAEAEVRAAAVARSAVDGAVGETAYAYARARAAVNRVVEQDPARLVAAQAALDAVIAFPPLSPEVQHAIDAAAALAIPASSTPPADTSIIPTTPPTATTTPTALDRWEVAVPLEVTKLAIGLLDVHSALEDLRSIDPVTLQKALDDVEVAYAAALVAQLAVQLRQDTAATEADAKRDEITAAAATAEARLLSLVRGDQ